MGALIIERSQLPHSYTKLDGTRYEVLTWNIRLRVERGPILFERYYVAGDDESVRVMRDMVVLGKQVEHDSEATWTFYEELHKAWSIK